MCDARRCSTCESLDHRECDEETLRQDEFDEACCGPAQQPIATNTPNDDMVRGYLECAEWCGLSEEDQEALELSVSPRSGTASFNAVKWSPESIEHAESVCGEFAWTFSEWTSEEEYRAGMDLWLTRNRHGAGFWDGDWPEPFASEATEWSHAEAEAFVTFDPESETLEIVA